MSEELLFNLDKLHTTELGDERIKRNLGLNTDDTVFWCKQVITDESCRIERKGKNWYARKEDVEITVNVHSYTIITAHKIKENKK